jgi:hypothetical protein
MKGHIGHARNQFAQPERPDGRRLVCADFVRCGPSTGEKVMSLDIEWDSPPTFFGVLLLCGAVLAASIAIPSAWAKVAIARSAMENGYVQVLGNDGEQYWRKP